MTDGRKDRQTDRNSISRSRSTCWCIPTRDENWRLSTTRNRRKKWRKIKTKPKIYVILIARSLVTTTNYCIAIFICNVRILNFLVKRKQRAYQFQRWSLQSSACREAFRSNAMCPPVMSNAICIHRLSRAAIDSVRRSPGGLSLFTALVRGLHFF